MATADGNGDEPEPSVRMARQVCEEAMPGVVRAEAAPALVTVRVVEETRHPLSLAADWSMRCRSSRGSYFLFRVCAVAAI